MAHHTTPVNCAVVGVFWSKRTGIGKCAAEKEFESVCQRVRVLLSLTFQPDSIDCSNAVFRNRPVGAKANEATYSPSVRATVFLTYTLTWRTL